MKFLSLLIFSLSMTCFILKAQDGDLNMKLVAQCPGTGRGQRSLALF